MQKCGLVNCPIRVILFKMISAYADIFRGFGQIRLWLMLSIDDLRIRYHRTLIGPLWIVISFLAFVGVKLLIFTGMSDTDGKYFASYLTLGFAVWQFVSSSLVDGTSTFIRNKNWIMGVKTPYSLFIYSTLSVSIYNFLVSFVCALAIAFFVHPFSLNGFGYSICGLLLLIYLLFWANLLLAVACIFARDLSQLVGTTMRIFFFLTPILWVPAALGEQSKFVIWNPFYHMLEVVRAPLMSGEFPVDSFLVVGSFAIVAQILASILFAVSRKWISSFI